MTIKDTQKGDIVTVPADWLKCLLNKAEAIDKAALEPCSSWTEREARVANLLGYIQSIESLNI